VPSIATSNDTRLSIERSCCITLSTALARTPHSRGAACRKYTPCHVTKRNAQQMSGEHWRDQSSETNPPTPAPLAASGGHALLVLATMSACQTSEVENTDGDGKAENVMPVQGEESPSARGGLPQVHAHVTSGDSSCSSSPSSAASTAVALVVTPPKLLAAPMQARSISSRSRKGP
jgi:hypothetical protein